jgi:cell division transport system permease protein
VIASWAARHGQALLSSAGHLSRKPVATLFTVMVMALALSLPLALGVLVQNVQAVTGNFSDAIGLSVYLKTGTAEQRARQLVQAASSQKSVEPRRSRNSAPTAASAPRSMRSTTTRCRISSRSGPRATRRLTKSNHCGVT